MSAGAAPPGAAAASPWIVRFAGEITPAGSVLDVAAGGGRHTRELLRRGHRVVAVDIDTTGLRDLAGSRSDVEVVEADLEADPWPLLGRQFDAVVVTNYLHRPLVPTLLGSLAAGGLLLYETYARGQERFGRPTNPDFLLRPGELLEVAAELTVLAFEDVVLDRPARVQRIAAVAGIPRSWPNE